MGQQDDPRIEFYGQDIPTPEMRQRDHAAEVRELVGALEWIQAWFKKLEDDTEDGDPLKVLRQKYHAPVHAKIDAALAKMRQQ